MVCREYKKISSPYFHENNSINGQKYLDILNDFFIQNVRFDLDLNGYF